MLYKVSSFLDHCSACFITVTSFTRSCYLWLQKTYCKVSRLTQYTLVIPVSVGQLSTQLNWDYYSGCLTRLQWRYLPWLWSNLKAWLRKGPLPSSFAYLLAGFSSFRAIGPRTSVTSYLLARGFTQYRASWASLMARCLTLEKSITFLGSQFSLLKTNAN